jgi:phage tail-like protein
MELPALRLWRVQGLSDMQPLQVINRDPTPDERGVPLESVITLEIALLDDSTLVLDSVEVLINGAAAFQNQAPQSGFDGPRAGLQTRAQSVMIALDLTKPFESQARVIVRVLANTASGAALDETYAFTTEDRVAPKLVAAVAQTPRLLRLSFDEPIQIASPDGVRLTPVDLPSVTPRVESALATDNILDLTLDTEMTPDARYEVWAHGVADRVGNGCAPPFDRVTVRGFRPERPSNRRFDLWEMLPRFNRREDTTGDLWRFIACLQDVTDLLLADIDRMSDRWDIDRVTERDLDLILQDIGNPFDLSLDLTSKRRLAGCLVAMYRDKGTARGIRDAVRFFLGIEVQIVTFTDTSMRLGESALNDDWELGTDDRRLRFAFSVRAPSLLTQIERDHIRILVNYLKPAHTHLWGILEPENATPSLMWEVGVSLLGDATFLDAQRG